jgi:hypothetical protein
MAAMRELRAPITLTVGMLAVCAGVLLTAAELGSGYGASSPYLWFFGVLALGGAALLATAWHPARLTTPVVVAIGVVAALGTAAGLAVERTAVCCAFAYHQTRGFPFPWMGRGFEWPDYLDDNQLAARMNGLGWELRSGEHAVANVIFWAFVALILVVAVRLGVAARRAYAGQRDDAQSHPEPVDISPVDA